VERRPHCQRGCGGEAGRWGSLELDTMVQSWREKGTGRRGGSRQAQNAKERKGHFEVAALRTARIPLETLLGCASPANPADTMCNFRGRVNWPSSSQLSLKIENHF
jgi:hypothetical protein